MKRRALLASLAVVSAGCLSEPTDQTDRESPAGGGARTTGDDTVTDGQGTTTDGQGTTTDGQGTTTDDDSSTTDDGSGDDGTATDEYEPDWAMPEDPAVSLDVGSRDDLEFPGDNQPWDFAIWNDTGSDATVHVVVSKDDSSAVERRIDLSARDWIDLSLLEPADYHVMVDVDGDERWGETYSPGSFTCNSKRTSIALGPDGAVRTRTLQTSLACGSATVADTTLTAGTGDCNDGTSHEATVTFEDGSVSVDGTVVTPTPCFDLSLDAAAVTNDGAELTVTVGATRQDGVCVECVGAVDYGATVDMQTDYPQTVVVEHVVDGDRTVVTRAER